jgi:iron complex transport system ATP-binding protein
MKGSCLNLSGTQVKRSGRTILDIDNLRIRSGEFIGIIGANGAGKTTLLKVCCGLIKPSRGTIEFDNTDLATLSSWSKSNLRKRIGYIPQATEYNSELPFTLREVVAMGRTSVKPLFSRLNRDDYEHIDYWIDKLGLTSRRNQTFRSLSGGEQQKALLARAMSQTPAILMLDEPCSNLDFNWKYQITDIIDELYRSATGGHITVLMVSHETGLLPAGCDRIVLLNEARILADDVPEKVLKSDAIEKAYQCQIETVEIDGRKYTISKKYSDS